VNELLAKLVGSIAITISPDHPKHGARTRQNLRVLVRGVVRMLSTLDIQDDLDARSLRIGRAHDQRT